MRQKASKLTKNMVKRLFSLHLLHPGPVSKLFVDFHVDDFIEYLFCCWAGSFRLFLTPNQSLPAFAPKYHSGTRVAISWTKQGRADVFSACPDSLANVVICELAFDLVLFRVLCAPVSYGPLKLHTTAAIQIQLAQAQSKITEQYHKIRSMLMTDGRNEIHAVAAALSAS